MSESAEDKTEEPTERRLAESVEKGEGPKPRETQVAAALLGICGALYFGAPGLTKAVARAGRMALDRAGQTRLAVGSDVAAYLSDALLAVGASGVAVAGALFGGALAAAAIDGRLRPVWTRLKPDAGRLSPGRGLARLFGRDGAIESAKAVAKLLVLALVLGRDLARQLAGLAQDGRIGAAEAGQRMHGAATGMALHACIAVACVAALDIAVERWRWRRRLRMTRQEMKDEIKSQEGDAHAKARMRAVASGRIRRNMLRNVGRASVVVANPTHYAVALRYVRGEDAAPVAVAKGQELIALAIRRRAAEAGVPIVENKALARAMFEHVEIDRAIPAQFYEAVAEIINFLSARERRPR